MILHINDLHLAAIRTGGTTPQTAWELRQYLLRSYAGLLEAAGNEDVFINGDWLDTANVPMIDLLETYRLTADWLLKGHRPKLYASRGNHDAVKNSTAISSFDLLSQLLQERFPQQVEIFTEPGWLNDQSYVIPHLPNQELFNLALQAVPPCKYLFLHCNFDNKFAEQADHSLNLSIAQAEAIPCERVIIAHEHQRRDALNGKVLVVGNQFPSSIADCLGNTAKYLLSISTDKLEWLPTWQREGNFVQMDWEELNETTAQFVRVVGEASAEDAARVVANISKFRAKSKALVITNAVQIEGCADGEQLQVSLESIKAFDVMEALMKYLDEREQGVVKALLKEHQ